MIGFVTWPPFIIVYRYKKGGQVTKPIILVKICYNIVCHSRSNLLALADIKPFGRAYLFAMLLLIGPALFTPQVFLFSISLLFVNKYHYFMEAYMQILL